MSKTSARFATSSVHAPPRTWEETHGKTAAAARYAAPSVGHDELAVLRAKAEVCDAYRRWLVTTSRDHRLRVNDTLIELARVEDAVADRGASAAEGGKDGCT